MVVPSGVGRFCLCGIIQIFYDDILERIRIFLGSFSSVLSSLFVQRCEKSFRESPLAAESLFTPSRKQNDTLRFLLGLKGKKACLRSLIGAFYSHVICNASPRRKEIQSNLCRSSNSSRRRKKENLQVETPDHCVVDRMDTCCPHMELL